MKDKYMLPQFSWAFFAGNNHVGFLWFCGGLVLWVFFKKLTDEVENCIMKTFHKSS